MVVMNTFSFPENRVWFPKKEQILVPEQDVLVPEENCYPPDHKLGIRRRNLWCYFGIPQDDVEPHVSMKKHPADATWI